jgi:hypothetical protein
VEFQKLNKPVNLSVFNLQGDEFKKGFYKMAQGIKDRGQVREIL